MKRLTLILIYSLFSVIRINAQNLTVDQTTYTVEQLVEEVLINSICANVSNISFSTGASTNENGIAFFEEPTGAFPFSEGLLLASGMLMVQLVLIQIRVFLQAVFLGTEILI